MHITSIHHACCVLFHIVAVTLCFVGSASNALSTLDNKNNQKKATNEHPECLEYYDLIVCGAGASGMFAAGTAAATFGTKTLLIDKYDIEEGNTSSALKQQQQQHVGGDCTNAACVPSKAIRSAAQVLSTSGENDNSNSIAQLARQHAIETVSKVRQRESPDRLAQTPNLDLIFTTKASFIQDDDNDGCSKTMQLDTPFRLSDNATDWEVCDNSDSLRVKGKKFIICTGASPTIPKAIEDSAKQLNVPILTYRSFFRPDGKEGLLSDQVLWNTTIHTRRKQQVVILGGGPSACEMAHTLGTLNQNKGTQLEITMIAATILPQEDVAARSFCRTLLKNLDIRLVLGQKATRLTATATADAASDEMPKAVVLLEDESQVPVDLIICATGRAPGANLEELQLERAGVKWKYQNGILVNSRLQSISAKHVFAAGDCASAVPKKDRRAAHAGWTGYHSVQSALFPRIFTPRDCIHPVVPRVVALDPEIASVGLTHAECVAQYGAHGFLHLKAMEEGTDRADMDSIGRPTIGFVELRASKATGRILGATICLPSAPEIANELGLAIRHKMTCRDMAKSIHYYPSYGYLMHRVALALAFSNVWGMLAAFGPLGRVTGGIGRIIQASIDKVDFRKRTKKAIRDWQAKGASQEFYFPEEDKDASNASILSTINGISFLEVAEKDDLCQAARELVKEQALTLDVSNSTTSMAASFVEWMNSKPN
ncbi:unnamed protein product [Cylindrotheca closterium]|uniref:Uncharacterized protein n=1 Tax=Cylindrotheca closterium TaxID=2856 RepID=A0AAD2FEH9_9STRA|nr:unnamed protein product [Cylindrotheca closterium]